MSAEILYGKPRVPAPVPAEPSATAERGRRDFLRSAFGLAGTAAVHAIPAPASLALSVFGGPKDHRPVPSDTPHAAG